MDTTISKIQGKAKEYMGRRSTKIHEYQRSILKVDNGMIGDNGKCVSDNVARRFETYTYICYYLLQ